jgi:hypothetical protein
MVTVALVVIIGILLLLGFVVYRARPHRFRLSAGVWKILTLSVEVDSGPGNDAQEPDGGSTVRREIPASEVKALPEGANATERAPR